MMRSTKLVQSRSDITERKIEVIFTRLPDQTLLLTMITPFSGYKEDKGLLAVMMAQFDFMCSALMH